MRVCLCVCVCVCVCGGGVSNKNVYFILSIATNLKYIIEVDINAMCEL